MIFSTPGAWTPPNSRQFVRLLLIVAALVPAGTSALALAPGDGAEHGGPSPAGAHWLRLAEQQGKEVDAVPADPNLTTASYGDWVLRCERADKAARVRVCDVAQTVPTQDLQGALAQISIAKPEASGPLHIYGLLPANIALPGSATMKSEEGALELELNWRRCLPSGCVSEAEASPSVLDRWRKLTGGGKIVYKDAGGSEVTVPVSFRGLRQALDALDKEQ